MKKLDDIPKKHPFTVPEDYFEKLPGIVQARVQPNAPAARRAWGHAMRYAMAVFVVAIVASVWWWRSGSVAGSSNSPEAILASLETADLVAYLNEGDITTDELLDDVRLSSEDASQIEENVFNLELNDSDIKALTNEID